MSTFSKEPDGSLSEATRKNIVAELHKFSDEWTIEKFPSEHRNHLGVSEIGELCSRKLWYKFRWVKLEQHDPHMRRLFNRGHNEENLFIEMLLWMGFHIREIDQATQKQYQFSKLNGHYGGSGDTIALLPWFRASESDRILVEYKTHNLKSFNLLKDQGLLKSKPKHYAQMSGYGREFKTRYGLYCALCKDNDRFHFELVELDWNYAQQLEVKANDIINAKFPPQRISEQPSYFECKWCVFNGICHYNEPVEVNCRSCKLATPVEDGKWHCSRFNAQIPKDFLKQGCSGHVSITN